MIRRCWHWFFAEQRGGVVARVWWQLASFLQNTLELHHDTQGAAQLGKASRCANPSAGLSGFVCVATVEVAHVAFNLIRAQPCSGQHLAFMCLGGAFGEDRGVDGGSQFARTIADGDGITCDAFNRLFGALGITSGADPFVFALQFGWVGDGGRCHLGQSGGQCLGGLPVAVL